MKKYRYWSILPVLGMMVLIFSFSAQPAVKSSGTSSGIAHAVVRYMDKVGNLHLTEEQKGHLADKIHTPIRKAAHMAEYGMLGITVAFCLSSFGRKGKKLLWKSEAICCLYAATDEFHQLFVSGRSCQGSDIFIDSMGAFIGCIVLCGILSIKRNKKR